MDRLWAPWRMQYIDSTDKPQGCIFCVLPAENRDSDNLILYRGKHCFIMMNSFPYNPGHLMVAPYKHTADMYELTDPEMLEINHLVRYSIKLLSAQMQPHGFNMGVNIGRTAGAGVLDHIHWHIVPRWDGDTNFMSVTASTRVLPDSLPATYAKLRAKMAEIGVPGDD